MALLYFTVLFRETQSFARGDGRGRREPGGIAGALRRLVRDPVRRRLFLDRRDGGTGSLAALLFSVIAALGPLYWLGHNWWIYTNPLEFLQRALFGHEHLPARAGAKHGALSGRSRLAQRPRSTIRRRCAVRRLGERSRSGSLGLAGVSCKRMFWPLLLAALPPLFYVWSMHSGGTPIFVPDALAFFVTTTRVTRSPRCRCSRSRAEAWCCSGRNACGRGSQRRSCIAASRPGSSTRSPSDWVTWKESQVNSDHAPRLDQGSRVLTRRLLPFRPGNHNQLRRPDGNPAPGRHPVARSAARRRRAGLDGRHHAPRFVSARRVGRGHRGRHGGDSGSEASLKTGPRYHLVQTVKVKGAPVIEIYKRD